MYVYLSKYPQASQIRSAFLDLLKAILNAKYIHMKPK